MLDTDLEYANYTQFLRKKLESAAKMWIFFIWISSVPYYFQNDYLKLTYPKSIQIMFVWRIVSLAPPTYVSLLFKTVKTPIILLS